MTWIFITGAKAGMLEALFCALPKEAFPFAKQYSISRGQIQVLAQYLIKI
jgi:hypothetical protein